MAAIFRIFFMTILSLSILMMVSLVFSVFKNNSDYFSETAKKLKALIGNMMDELIPIDVHEIKILSWATILEKTKKGISSGYLSTIFQEKMVAFTKEKLGSETIILHAETSKQAYTFHKQGNITKVFLSDIELGTIRAYRGFYELKAKGALYKAIHSDSNSVQLNRNDEALADVFLGGGSYASDRLFKMIHQNEFIEDDSFLAFILYLILLKTN